MCVCIEIERSPSEFLGSMGMMPAHHGQLGGSKALPVPFGGSSHRLGGINEPVQLPLAQIVQHVDSLMRREVQIGSFPTHVLVAEMTSPVPGQRQAETGDGLVNPLLAWFSEAACEPQTTGSTSAAPTP